MILTRRRVLEVGGGILAALLARPAAAWSASVEIAMQGRPDGSHVWFDPIGLHIEPGQTVRWINRDRGNSHTVTSYHPEIFDRPRRIPAKAKAWDSGYLLPEETFSVRFDEEGVYDYYCVPHEHAGMVGRIVVGKPPAVEAAAETAGLTPLPEAALNGFPQVEEIIDNGIVRRE
ncbi:MULTISPECIES: plastocyanin/azurin family copper-binding protein [Chelativorans]|jgi:plastocyanin|uniref:Blue (Type 1) copper domain n=1 Tax=Chelativorans sp. (strain BNC1) TaxID=266779 RepID=Q11IY5_CHESB|nr:MULTISPECIES: plastocyanin/azurin family copper-binding protein [Chelativorans]